MPRDNGSVRITRRASRAPAAARDGATSRTRILEAATAEFARRGLGGARVDRIAAAASANKRMLYYYFGSKDGLFLAVLESAYERIRAAEAELTLEDLVPEEAIRRLVAFTWNYFVAHPEFITLLNNENLHQARHLSRSTKIRAMNSPVIRALRAILRRGRREGLFRANPDPLQLYISIAALGYFYLSNNATLATVFDRNLDSTAARRVRLAHMTELVLAYLRHGGRPSQRER